MHKTATTTLQRQVFPALDSIRYFSKGSAIDAFVSAVTTQDPIYFDGKRQRSAVLEHVDPLESSLISREALSGALYAGVGKRRLDHRSPILQNLHSALPEARVILVLRRQDSLAISTYRQYLKLGGTETIYDFYGLSGRAPIIPLDRFEFFPYVKYVTGLFPTLVLTFEEFCQSPAYFLGKLADFLGTTVPEIAITESNRRMLGSKGLECSRVANRFFKSQLNPNGLLPRLMPGIQDRWPVRGKITSHSRIQLAATEILERSREGNRELDLQYNLGLASYGYYQ